VSSFATDINDAGEVIGAIGAHDSNFEINVPIAFFWNSTDGVTSIGTIGSGTFSFAHEINELGQVVGHSEISPSGDIHAFIWDSTNGIVDLTPGLASGLISSAEEINDAGQVVGSVEISTGIFHAFIWDSTNGILDLGTLPGGSFSSAISINMEGEVVGDSDDASFNEHATLWDVSGIFGLPPEADDNSAPSTFEDTSVVITLTASDVDGDSTTFSILADPHDGTLVSKFES